MRVGLHKYQTTREGIIFAGGCEWFFKDNIITISRKSSISQLVGVTFDLYNIAPPKTGDEIEISFHACYTRQKMPWNNCLHIFSCLQGPSNDYLMVGQGAPYFRRSGAELVSKPAVSLSNSWGPTTVERLDLYPPNAPHPQGSSRGDFLQHLCYNGSSGCWSRNFDRR